MASKHRIPLKQGYILEGYRISEVLGGGGFSLVYLAKEVASDKEMVVKEYCPKSLVSRNPDGTIEPLTDKARMGFIAGMKQFFGEANALAKLNHPNIVNVNNIFRANNTVYMVMNYELGRDLRWFIKQCHGQLDQPFMLKVFPPVASGLSKLHESGFLHLDVKPARTTVLKQ